MKIKYRKRCTNFPRCNYFVSTTNKEYCDECSKQRKKDWLIRYNQKKRTELDKK